LVAPKSPRSEKRLNAPLRRSLPTHLDRNDATLDNGSM
jgi:hypothetical protein